MSGTTTTTAKRFLTITQAIVSTFNAKSFSIHQSGRNFYSRCVINLLCSCSCYLHISSTFFLRKALFVDQANALILIYCQHNEVSSFTGWKKLGNSGHRTHFSASFRSGHTLFLSIVIDIRLTIRYNNKRHMPFIIITTNRAYVNNYCEVSTIIYEQMF